MEKIVRCIIQNEGEHFLWLTWRRVDFWLTHSLFPLFSANAEALKEMLGDNEGDIPLPVPR